jgi:16S rRNA (uracil1498-N3)-methyltransferase
MRRFFVDRPEDWVPQVGERVVLDAEQTKHLRTVLRASDGDELALTDGRGHRLVAVLAGGGKRGAEVELRAVDRAAAEVASPRLHLACAVVKGKRFEFAVEKAVELGVHAITPLRTTHGVIDPREGKHDRWRGLLVSALKQSGRCWLPTLNPVEDLVTVLDGATGPVHFGAAPGDLVAETLLQPAAAVAQAARRRLDGQQPPAELVVAIGPEGGWTTPELQLLAARDAVPLGLGPHVLRTETAAVVAVAALQQIRRAWLDRTGPAT